MTAAENTFIIKKPFTVTVISLLPPHLHPQTASDTDLRQLFDTVYHQRLHDTLKIRGLYGTGAARLSVNLNVVRAQQSRYWPYEAVPDLSTDDFSDDGKNADWYILLKQTIENGLAFIILFDQNTKGTAKDIQEDILVLDKKQYVPVVLQEIGGGGSRQSTTCSLESQHCLDSTTSYLTDAFERLCEVVKEEAGFIAPPKEAKRFVRRTFIQKVWHRIRSNFKRIL